MEVLEKHVALRREMNAFYAAQFKSINEVEMLYEPNRDFYSNHWLTAIIVNPKVSGKSREGLRLALEQQNIESRPLWKPMHLQPVFKDYPYYGSNVAEGLFDNGLCLPSGSNLVDIDKNRIAEVLQNYFN